jgi:choline dehydrogenase-like flavoprotein
MGRERFDAIVIGTGFGGSMSAYTLVHAGMRVLMIERGDWLERGPHNWGPAGVIYSTPEYTSEEGYAVRGEKAAVESALFCVGGLSVFYGGVSLRLREQDFAFNAEVSTESGGRWPYGYDDLEPYYARAEQLLGIAGEESVRAGGGNEGDHALANGAVGADPTAPRRSATYPQPMQQLSEASSLIGGAAKKLGLHPFRLPLAINHDEGSGRAACIGCLTCDAFACAIGAKNDLASAVLPGLIERGMRLEPNTVALQLVARSGRIESVECVDRRTGKQRSFQADQFILSAGSLSSPQLLLASRLHARNPGGAVVGRYLMRHCNGIVYGLFPRIPNPRREFHKQIAIHDYYLGHPAVREPAGKLGSIQQVHSPPVGLALERVPRAFHRFVPALIDRMTGLLVIAEDQGRYENHVAIDPESHDRFGMPRLTIHHRYTSRDRAARGVLIGAAKRVLRAAGARISYVHIIHTFSHAVGTVRMGEDAKTSALDHACRFRGIDNLRVIDGSFMPASGGLNPSLTIAANALRAAELML